MYLGGRGYYGSTLLFYTLVGKFVLYFYSLIIYNQIIKCLFKLQGHNKVILAWGQQ